MKYLAGIINILLAAATLYFCVEIFQKSVGPGADGLSDKGAGKTISQKINQAQHNRSTPKNQYNAIAMRNLFKVEIEEDKENAGAKEAEQNDLEPLERTSLKLALWGTVTGDSTVYAVIEDQKLRLQSLYEVGDSIQEAKIKKILRHKVILTYQDKDQVLEMESNDKDIQPLKKSVEKEIVRALPLNNRIEDILPDELTEQVAQIKFRPRFTEGKPDGLMVYGIRKNSIFRQLGLKNGDVIKDINGTAIVSAEDATAFFTELNSVPDTRVTLIRRGKVKELNFQDQEN